MRYRFLSISPFFLILLAFTISCVHAEEEPDIDITYVPQALADHLNISLFVAELLMSSLVLISVGLTLSILKAKGLLILIVTFPLMGVLVALAWLPVWIFLLLGLLVSLLYSDKIKRML